MQADSSVEGIEGQRGSALADPCAVQTIAAVDVSAVPAFTLAIGHSQGGDIEVAEDFAVEGFEAQVGGEIGLEVNDPSAR